MSNFLVRFEIRKTIQQNKCRAAAAVPPLQRRQAVTSPPRSGEPKPRRRAAPNAKAVASETSATFLRVVGSELIQKYLGDGPKLVRELFKTAQ